MIELNVGGRLRSRAWKLEPMEREVREGGKEDRSLKWLAMLRVSREEGREEGLCT